MAGSLWLVASFREFYRYDHHGHPTSQSPALGRLYVLGHTATMLSLFDGDTLDGDEAAETHAYMHYHAV